MEDTRLAPRSATPKAALGLLVFALAVALVAVLGGLAAASAGSDYLALRRPSWAPPPAVFGPVWAALYATIAVAGWLVWRRAGWTGARTALAVYGVQLVLNMAWTPLFFSAGLFGVALAEICVLWLSVVATVVLFARWHRLAAALLLPYLAWVTFAAALNFSLWQLN